MGSMRLQPVLEAFVLHLKGISIVQALSTVEAKLYDSGRPKIYYEYCAHSSISAHISRCPNSRKIIENKCCKWRIQPVNSKVNHVFVLFVHASSVI